MATFFRIVFAFFVGAALAAGAYAWHTKKDAERRLHEAAAAEQTCQASLNECGKGQAAEKNARESALDALDASQAELAELRIEREETEKRLAAMKSLTDKFRKMIDSGKLQVILRHGRMVVKLPAGILFASGSADLSKEGKDALREVAGVLRQVEGRRLMVAGHTDNIPLQASSPFKNNFELSTARALTVAQHLVASGLPPSRLVAAGYAEHEPVRSNASEAGRQETRRIEIVLLPNLTELPLDPLVDGGAEASAKSK